MKKRVVIFETIREGHRPQVAWYLARGVAVRVFDFTYHLKFLDWLRPLLLSGEVERVYFHPGSKAEGLGMDAAEWLYPRVSRHPLIRRLQRMFTNEEADPIFKYSLAREAATYFYARLSLQKARESEPDAEIIFIPDAFMDWHRALQPWCADRLKPLEGIRIPRWAAAWNRAAGSFARWIRTLPLYAGAGACLLLIGLGRLLSSEKRTKENRAYRVLYAVASKFQTKFSGGRRFDFLIDHQTLTKQNVAFCVDPAAEGPWVEEAHRLGYRMVRLSQYSGFKGLFRRSSRSLPLRQAFQAVWVGITRIGTPDWIQQAAFSGLRTWIKEGGFLERFHFLHYVYASQYAFVPRWRNALIRRTGSQSWYYAYSNGGAFLYQENPVFAGGKDFCGRIRFWAYDNADHFVSPCSQLVEYYRKHRQKVRWYHSVGNLWSEQILQIGKTQDLSAVRAQWFPSLQPADKVVAWFDTSFVEAPNSPSTFTEAIQWYGDILRLAEEIPELHMAIKPSKDAAYYVDRGPKQQWAEPRVGQRLIEIWEKLKVHPRIRFFDHSTDPTLVVAASDLTVTFCFSSVSAEALGVGKKGIWYEPGQRWRDAWYSRHTGLTAHGYEELKAVGRRLLFQTSDREYAEYLDQTVRGVVEEFLDGKGLSRFRALLAG